ncbi:hypothetical protein [Actinoplanes sp. L3-i22]|uniref:hypothetical protein n=1 Tax=Actinoplanes sp. L3-i22 TaxID=2836373 RepID=UPI001C85BC96|nr:hypothetical protein [Actinoplanes sp. L3-i22]
MKAAEEIEADSFGSGPLPADVINDSGNDLSEREVSKIATRLDDPGLAPRVQLLLSRERIFGTFLTSLVAAFPTAGKRSVEESADYVLDQLENSELLEELDNKVSYAAPVIPGSPCDVGDIERGNLKVPQISTGIDRALIDAAADLADITTVGDAMGVFAARTALVDRWAAGDFRFAGKEVNRFLYCFLRDRTDLTDDTRHRVQARVFGTPGVPAGTDVNTAFPVAFQRLLSALVRFDQDSRTSQSGKEPSRAQANIAAEEVRYNLDQAVTGVTELEISDLRAELTRALFVLEDDEVIQQVAGGDPDGIWAVVNRLLDRSGSTSRDLVAQFAALKARRDIFAFLRYEPGGGGPGENAAFAAAVEAAVTLETIESVPRPAQLAGAMNGQSDYTVDRLTTMSH